MLAGLLIAMHDADDRPGMLTATLPFGATTLIEYQARLLIGAGASQIVIVVARLTPELIGAISRIGRRGIIVDTVRSAAEAAEKLHPLAHVLMLADGLTTNGETIASMAREGGDALLVLPEGGAGGDYERLGGGLLWAGIARLDARRVTELASLPRDYDVQSTLIRLTSQARPVHVLLPAGALRSGHGIEHGGSTLELRGRGVLAALVALRRGWFDRLVVAPLAKAAIPLLAPRAVPSLSVAGVVALLGLLSLVLLWYDRPVAGLLVALLASIGGALAQILCDLRDEAPLGRTISIASSITSALVALEYGYRESLATGDGGAQVLASGLVVIAGLAERARGDDAPDWWWGEASACLVVLALGAIAAMPFVALSVAAGYATTTAAAAIARLRRQP